MSVHNSLKNFKQWVNTDLDSPKRKEVTNKIDQDLKLDSPSILKSIDGKYSPYRKNLSKLGKMQLDMVKMEKIIKTGKDSIPENK
tara:strand:- start:436 stop:690 length:255 start_codon:yes stop_codon:yes gene_type:complete